MVSSIPCTFPSPSIHGAASSYSAGVTSSLESALDPVVPSGSRSRANTSMSPPSHPSPFASMFPLFPWVSHVLDEGFFSSIAKTAIDAGDAFENFDGAEQTTKVGELRDRIVQVLDMLAIMSFAESDLAAPISAMGPAIPEPPMTIAPPIVQSVDPSGVEPALLAVSDQSRKRCASELEEHRTVKAMKREPQDDIALSLTIWTSFATPIPPPVTYPIMPPPIAVQPQSRPSSRPPTPSSAFAPHGSFAAVKQQTPVMSNFPSFINGSSTGILPSPPLPLLASNAPPPFPPMHTSWSDPIVPSSRHHHSLSAGSINNSLLNLPQALATAHQSTVDPFSQSVSQPGLSQSAAIPSNGAASSISPPIGRMSRSGSINGTPFKNPYATYTFADPYPDPTAWHTTKAPNRTSWYMGSEPVHPSRKSPSTNSDLAASQPSTAQNSPPSDGEDEDEDSDSDDSHSGKTVTNRSSSDRPSSTADVPPEYRADVDRIFFEFLNKLCSKLDATDSKGEQIHQTLMAKKMQRLDESPDFRPFKFRIQAFTNSFLDELASQGYPDEKIPTKKVRNYLWRQQYILRFNEDGKKAKSKGNHIWNIEAKKAGDQQWEFRPFHRKLAGSPPGVAYCGLRWSWRPHVWDPQFSFKKIAVSYSSPNLPAWLSWKNGELSGIPSPEAESCQITTIAKFVIDNQDSQVSHSFNLSIAPVSALDSASYSPEPSRRPLGDPPKRSTSDSALFQPPQRSNTARANRVDDGRVIRVLQSVAQRVTDEAESQFVSASPPKQGELQDLVKQKHVLEQTVDAYDKAISGQGHLQSRRLAVAAQHVVLQAARTVLADRTVAIGGVPAPQTETVSIQSVSVSELTDTTQDAIAMAVKMNGTASNEVDIIVTATSILKSRTPVHETPSGVLTTQAHPVSTAVPPSRITSTFPSSNLSTLAEYV
ncbi:hypothetical protein B0H34DRAFT_781171 [Crassisporium funariophilum]|nr:hypothetical protein B0H34DRAFT_781171 [Crassisporium funariophilum]